VAVSIGVLDLETKQQSVISDSGSYPRYINGFVLYAQQSNADLSGNPFSGGVLAVPFDVHTLKVTGRSAPVLDQVRVYSGGAGNFDVAANGTITFVPGTFENTKRDLGWLTPVSDGAPATAEPLRGSTGNLATPRLSLDDRSVLVQLNNGNSSAAYVYSIERGSFTRVPSDGAAGRPIFGPGPDDATFANNATNAPTSSLLFAPIDGSRPPQRLMTHPGLLVPGAWSRDGQYLVFTAFKDAIGDVMVLKRGEHDATALVATPNDEHDPALSPNDRWIAYSSNESGRTEVYVRPFPGPGGRLPISTDGGAAPVWAKDGRRLFYVRNDTTLMAVDIVSETPFRATPPNVVLTSDELIGRGFAAGVVPLRGYDVTRGGRVLVTRSPDTDARIDHVRVTLNFDREIARRLRIPLGREP
jgi:hypothetical protein